MNVLAVLSSLFSLACASSPRATTRFEREFQRYLSLPNQKVMAIAGDPKGHWVHGYGYAFMSSGQAEVAALEQCNVRKESLDPGAECVVYAVGSRVVWQPPGEGPRE